MRWDSIKLPHVRSTNNLIWTEVLNHVIHVYTKKLSLWLGLLGGEPLPNFRRALSGSLLKASRAVVDEMSHLFACTCGVRARVSP